ncbi:MAG: hypothetical protein A2Y38_19440 [Spirochaetes bacterium GWB1_59_5]|nr:MAG: hypothetical protein A2Y38_19440 [Spirochaetes bacterium GWB1_59_5]
MPKKKPSRHIVKMGVGEAVDRLIRINHMLGAGIANIPQEFIEERRIITEALNHIKLDLAFDCDGDSNPDTVEIFQHAAKTSCCRILPLQDDDRPHIYRYRSADGEERTMTPVGRTLTPAPDLLPRTLTPMPRPLVPVGEPVAPPEPAAPDPKAKPFKPRGTAKPRTPRGKKT